MNSNIDIESNVVIDLAKQYGYINADLSEMSKGCNPPDIPSCCDVSAEISEMMTTVQGAEKELQNKMSEVQKALINTLVLLSDCDDLSYSEYEQLKNLVSLFINNEINDNNDSSYTLNGDELRKFAEDNNIRLLDTLVVKKGIVNINGIDFNIYYVIDGANYNQINFNNYVSKSQKTLENIDESVLKFVSNSGTSIVYFSGYTVDNGLYDENGVFVGDGGYSGYCNSYNRNIISVNNGWNDYEAILHEFGHAFDFSLYNRATVTGHVTKGISQIVNDNPGSFYNIARLESQTLFDPLALNLTFIESKVYEWDDGHSAEFYYYQLSNGEILEFYRNESGMHNGEFSGYSNNELVNDYGALEYFAESFRKYYTQDKETNLRYKMLIPNTFKYIDSLVESVERMVD